MADIKLGSKTFTGIKTVSMNIPDGGKQTFSSGGGGASITPVSSYVSLYESFGDINYAPIIPVNEYSLVEEE